MHRQRLSMPKAYLENKLTSISLLTNAATALAHDALPAAKDLLHSGKLSMPSLGSSQEAMEALKSVGTKLQSQLMKAVPSGPASALMNDIGKFGLSTGKLKNAVKLTQAKLQGVLSHSPSVSGGGAKPSLLSSPMSGNRLQSFFKTGAAKKEEAASQEEKPALSETPHAQGKPEISESETEKPAASASEPKVSADEAQGAKPQQESVELEDTAVGSEHEKPAVQNHEPAELAPESEAVKPHHEDEKLNTSAAENEGKTEVAHNEEKPEVSPGEAGKTEASHASEPAELSAHNEIQNTASAHEQLHGMISDAENSINAAENKISQNPQAGKNSHLSGILSDLRTHLNQIKSDAQGKIPSLMNSASSLMNKVDMPSLMQAGNSLFQAVQVGMKMVAENILAHAQMLAEINKMANAAMVAAV